MWNTSVSVHMDYAAIERILPHRYPFLLVDRVTELEPDRRIVGIKNVSLNERYLWHDPDEAPVLPATILTEAIAQVGAILILSKPENREKLIFFMGIERVRYRRAVHPGDVVEIEAVVKRLRSRMGVLSGAARVNGKVVCNGTMTFALGPKTGGAEIGAAGLRPVGCSASLKTCRSYFPAANTNPTDRALSARDVQRAHAEPGR